MSRNMIHRAARLNVGSARSTSRIHLPAQSRSYSLATCRISAVALGKRPAYLHLLSATPVSLVSTRNLSWTPWKASNPAPAVAEISESISTATPLHDPILSSSRPDLQPTASSSAAIPSPISTNNATTLSSDAVDPSLLHSTSFDSTSSGNLSDVIYNSTLPLKEILATPEAVHATCTKADLPLIGLEHAWYSAPGWAVDGMVGLHNLTGLPWWATIGAMTVLIRLSLFRAYVGTMKHNARLTAVTPQMNELMEVLKEAKKTNNNHEMTMAQRHLNELFKENNVHPLRGLKMIFFQIPVFVTMFSALRRMADAPIPGLHDGGFGWVTDLTLQDPYYILPITSMVLTNIVLRVGADGMASSNGTSSGRHMQNVVQVITLISIPFVGRWPAVLLFYWTFTNAMTLTQAMFLRQTFVRRLLNIPVKAETVEADPNAKRPTFRETAKAMRDGYLERIQSVNAQIAPGAARQKISAERIQEVLPEGSAIAPATPAVASSGRAQKVKAVRVVRRNA